jgi:A/G-specific adenine glycosylase
MRDLPWRRSRDPYAVWVSEIMLQQTRVAQAGPYFERFMRRFPTVKALARARPQSVLKAWEGMGYYSRARNLHRAAREVVERHGGRLPDTAEELIRLPGIGRYTAGAIASIAFGRAEPVLDGNVARVLCRLYALVGDPKSAPVQGKLWDLARRLMPAREAGLFNQALMDLGAMVCVPRNPRCAACPLAPVCAAHAQGRQDRYPEAAPRKAVPHEIVAAGLVWKRGKILIRLRPERGLLGGLWELPQARREGRQSLRTALLGEVRDRVGLKVSVGKPIAAVDHAYTHFRITLHVLPCTYQSGRARAAGCEAIRWVEPRALGRFPFPRAHHKVFALLSDHMKERSRREDSS